MTTHNPRITNTETYHFETARDLMNWLDHFSQPEKVIFSGGLKLQYNPNGQPDDGHELLVSR